MTRLFINYLLQDVIVLDLGIRPSFNIEIGIEEFHIGHSDFIYKEKIFDSSQPEIYPGDILFLDKVYETAMKYKTLDFDKLENNLASITSRSLLKLIYFFTNEQYFSYPLIKDKYGRCSSESIRKEIYKYLDIPISDILIRIFLNQFQIKPERFLINYTCDYDILHYWEHLGLISTFKRMLKSIFMLRLKQFFKEVPSILWEKNNVRYNYFLNDAMFSFKEMSFDIKIRNIAFFHLHQSNIKYDPNNNFSTKALRNFIQILEDKQVIFGLHPSYGSSSDKASLEQQQLKFKSVFGRKSMVSRFHYLKYSFPEDLSCLEQIGVSEDFSFGFANDLIFRGGITKTFRMWDNLMNKPYSVKLTPLVLMDGSFSDYLKSDLKRSTAVCVEKINKVFFNGFQLTLLWHNRSMYQYGIENNIHPDLFKNVIDHIHSFSRSKSNVNS